MQAYGRSSGSTGYNAKGSIPTTMKLAKPIHEYAFIRRLTKLPFVDAIVLYGSRARNDNTERSDIDLAILCPKASNSDWSYVMEIIDKADTLLKIDCVRLDALSESHPLRKSIAEDGKIVFQRSRNDSSTK